MLLSCKEKEMKKELDILLKKPTKKAKLYNHFNITEPDYMHQADLLFLPTDNGYKYALCLVDVASRYKAARPLKTKLSYEIVDRLHDIYNTDNLMEIPKYLNFDKGGEFNSRLMWEFCKTNNIKIVYNVPTNHLSFVENFNKELAKKLFRFQQLKELETKEENSEWVGKLQSVVKQMNNTKTKLINMKPIDAYHLKYVKQPEDRHSEEDCKLHYDVGQSVKRILNIDEFQNVYDGFIKKERRRATDTYWSLENYEVVDLYQRSKTSLIEHKIKDSEGNIYPHTFTYFQLIASSE